MSSPGGRQKMMLLSSLKPWIFLQYGRRVICLKLWDPTQVNHDEMLCILYQMILLLAREPKTQIAGISVISDQAGLSYSHVPSWGMVLSYPVLVKASFSLFADLANIWNAWLYSRALWETETETETDRFSINLKPTDARFLKIGFQFFRFWSV
jgi:hypothetical protein